jgi:two-component system CheB/CheR fusion protein
MRERQRLEREIAAIADEERRRLGHELHDGVCQQLTAALLRCQALELSARQGAALADAEFEPLQRLLTETIDDAHDVARGLCPLAPDPGALGAALRALTGRIGQMAGVRCEFVAKGDVRVAEPTTAHHLYRLAQEALSNAARHAKATRITVELRGGDGELAMQVEDDGAGLPPAGGAGGMGLRTMGYRARLVGGDLKVTSSPGKGTCVVCRVPRTLPPLAAGPEESGGGPWIPR